ncbi:hypothetical protein D5H75_24350 [Bailinhaonella thermotolerans]|uniref:Uncharacterized protein n=1 Tax=Bailinhaonella thermotolerans TaxID=1070861 RepID=A0A3A4ARZ9_9ACTN|nr:hypothetical protein D5H75_24350 [Bailinhaonella thermotolerans]
MGGEEWRGFLAECFGVGAEELFVAHGDRVNAELAGVPEDVRFAVFCTYQEMGGHFAQSFDVGIEGRMAERVGRREFAERLAARFDAYVLYGDTEPPGLWSLVLPDATRLLVAMDEEEDRAEIYLATGVIPGLPDVPVDEGLWALR